MISTYELELFSKQAAAEYLKGGKPLNESITKIASANALNTNQVKRVVEAANTEAYMSLFNASDDKYVSFVTADPSIIEENMSLAKTASAVDDTDYFEPPAYETVHHSTPITKVAEEVVEVRSEEQTLRDYYVFKAAEAHFDNMVIESQLLFSSEAEKLGLMIKQAVLSGTDYSEIKAALNTNSDPIFVATLDAIEKELTPMMPIGSIEKTAAVTKGSVNVKHPLLQQSLRLVKIANEHKVIKNKLEELLGEWEMYKAGGERLKNTVELFRKSPKVLATGLAVGAGATALAMPMIADHANATNNSVLKQVPENYRG